MPTQTLLFSWRALFFLSAIFFFYSPFKIKIYYLNCKTVVFFHAQRKKEVPNVQNSSHIIDQLEMTSSQFRVRITKIKNTNFDVGVSDMEFINQSEY